MTPIQYLNLRDYRSLGWSNQPRPKEFWEHYHAHKWEVLVKSPGYTLEVCHETKEYIETDSSD